MRIEDIALFERVDPRVASTNTALAVKKFARNVSAVTRLLRNIGSGACRRA